jgi:hypothetical protein
VGLGYEKEIGTHYALSSRENELWLRLSPMEEERVLLGKFLEET